MPGRPPVALTIAGSDSGGGAGIQADLKTFASLGVFGCSVITSLTAQNTVSVSAIHDPPPEFIARQLEAVLRDIPVDAAKTGMLHTGEAIEVVADGVRRYGVEKLVVDPVMIATSGDRLLREEALEALVEKLLPLALIVTPNLPEAEVLSGMRIETSSDAERAARRIRSLGPKLVLIKGGHMEGESAIDLLFDGESFHKVGSERIGKGKLHGTGCVLSAAITAYLARGLSPLQSVRKAKEYLLSAIKLSFPLGKGSLVLGWECLKTKEPEGRGCA